VAADTTLDNHVKELNTEENIVKLGWTPTKDMIEKKTKEVTKPLQKHLFPEKEDKVEVTAKQNRIIH
jgi:hypothetical protein